MRCIAWLWNLTEKKGKARFVTALVISAVTSVLLLVNPTLSAKLVDDVIVAQNPEPLLGLLAVTLFVVLSAAVGLVLGVLMPSFHWTSETAVIKQSPFCLLAMLLSWGAALALFAGTAALSHRMPPAVSLSLACLLLAGADALTLRWLKTKGAARFETT